MHPVEGLFNELQGFWYPPEVTPTPRILPETAFFPGGYGLWGTAPGQALPPWPEHGIMVLGHNFSSKSEWDNTIAPNDGDILGKGTWSHLLPLLDRAGIQREECFFTNVYMGLGDKHEGEFSGASNEDFVRQCQSFFQLQFLTQQPRLILALGIPVHRFLSEVSTVQGKLTSWGEKLRRLDSSAEGPVVDGVGFDLCSPDCSTTVVALVHPANRPTRTVIGVRCYGGLQGDDAELAMLDEAMRLAGFQTWKFVCHHCEAESILFSCQQCTSSKLNVHQYHSLVTGIANNSYCCPICGTHVAELICPKCGRAGQICAA